MEHKPTDIANKGLGVTYQQLADTVRKRTGRFKDLTDAEIEEEVAYIHSDKCCGYIDAVLIMAAARGEPEDSQFAEDGSVIEY